MVRQADGVPLSPYQTGIPCRSAGVALSLDDFQRLSDKTPFIADLKPSGKYVMEDVHKARVGNGWARRAYRVYRRGDTGVSAGGGHGCVCTLASFRGVAGVGGAGAICVGLGEA